MDDADRIMVYKISIAIILVSLFGMWALYQPSSMITGFVVADLDQGPPIESVPTPTMDEALSLLVFADDVRMDMTYYNLSTFFVNDTIYVAQRQFMGKDFTNESVSSAESKKQVYIASLVSVFNITPEYDRLDRDLHNVSLLVEFVNRTRKVAFEVLDQLALVDKKEREYNRSGIYTGQGKMLISEARLSFAGERYTEAKGLIVEAHKALDASKIEANRVRDLLLRSKNFIIRYWWQIIVVLAILAYLSAPAFRHARMAYGKWKSQRLQEEVDVIMDLMKENQRAYLMKKSISQNVFKSREEQFQTKLVALQHTIPVYQAMAKGESYKKQKEGVLSFK